jgi:hypothetical protein
MLRAVSNNVHTKPCIVLCIAQLGLQVDTPALYLGGPCLKHVSADLV